MAVEVGLPAMIDLVRAEGDSNDVVVHLLNTDGTSATVVGWTGVLSVGVDADSPLAPPKTYPGVGVSGGLLPINMNGFDVPIGSYKYDIRIIDTVTGDTPARVYFKGKFRVTPRIN